MPVRDALATARHGGWVPYYDERVDPIHAAFMEHECALDLFEAVAWSLTIGFAVADVVTTSVGLTHPLLEEAVPISGWVIDRFGWPGLAIQHAVTLGLLAVLWQALPRPYRLVVPLEGAWAGYIITYSNIAILLTYGLLL